MRAQATTHSKVTFLNSSTRGTILGEEAEWLTEDFRMSLLSGPLLERLCVTPQEDAMKEIPKFMDKIKTLYWKYSKARMYQRRSMLLRSKHEERFVPNGRDVRGNGAVGLAGEAKAYDL